MATMEDLDKLDIRVGTVTRVEPFPKARRPAYKIWVDFGGEIGVKQSSAQLTELYTPDDLTGRQVLAVVNFPPRQVADFFSEILILGAYTDRGVVLIRPEAPVDNGAVIG